MTLTEEEAKKKWCPYANTTARGAANVGSWNRFEDSPPEKTAGVCCIASECMAWRWTHMRHFAEPANTSDLYPDNKGYLARKNGDDMERIGYCGLAGAP